MGASITARALDVVRRSLELADADPAQMGVRLRLAGGEVRPRFAPAPEPDDVVIEDGGIRVFVDRRIVDELPDVVIDVSTEHEQLVVRPGAGG